MMSEEYFEHTKQMEDYRGWLESKGSVKDTAVNRKRYIWECERGTWVRSGEVRFPEACELLEFCRGEVNVVARITLQDTPKCQDLITVLQGRYKVTEEHSYTVWGITSTVWKIEERS